VKRFCIAVALSVSAWGCADSVERDGRRAYELTLPAADNGSGWSISRESGGRVATWQIRIEGSWNQYAEWARPRLLPEFDSVIATDGQRLVFGKSLAGDVYTLELRLSDPPQGSYVSATFTARPF
jgi:hypothetical protein